MTLAVRQLTWGPRAVISHDGHEVTVEEGTLVPSAPGVAPVFRASTDADGIRLRRYGPDPGAALRAVLEDLEDMALAALLREEDEGAGDAGG